ncbi:MAG: hypothetical protein WCH58_03530 [Candidatus Saccharibacteria bacterium]
MKIIFERNQKNNDKLVNLQPDTIYKTNEVVKKKISKEKIIIFALSVVLVGMGLFVAWDLWGKNISFNCKCSDQTTTTNTQTNNTNATKPKTNTTTVDSSLYSACSSKLSGDSKTYKACCDTVSTDDSVIKACKAVADAQTQQ